MNRGIYAGAAVLCTAAVFGGAMYWPANTEITPTSSPTAAIVSASRTFAPSMAGTQPDGEIRNGSGRLVVGPELLLRFDYYLAAVHDRTLADIQHQIELDLGRELVPADAARAKDLLGRYLRYRQELATMKWQLPLETSRAQAMRAQLTGVRALRDRHFLPQDVKALFSDAEAREEAALARFDVIQDSTLSAAQKAARLADLNAEGGTRSEMQRVEALAQQVAAARANGATDAEVFSIRAAQFGSEAASRMATVDQERSTWQQRIEVYKAERSKLLLNASLSEAEREVAIGQLQTGKFSSEERLRLAAYE